MQQSIRLFSMHQCYLKWKKNQFEIVTMLRHWDNEKRTELPGTGTCEAEAWRYQMENSKRRKSSTWEEIAMNWSDINTSMLWQFYLETSSATLTSARTIWLISKQLSALLGTCCFLQHWFFFNKSCRNLSCTRSDTGTGAGIAPVHQSPIALGMQEFRTQPAAWHLLYLDMANVTLGSTTWDNIVYFYYSWLHLIVVINSCSPHAQSKCSLRYDQIMERWTFSMR